MIAHDTTVSQLFFKASSAFNVTLGNAGIAYSTDSFSGNIFLRKAQQMFPPQSAFPISTFLHISPGSLNS